MSREARVLKLADALTTSPQFSTESAYEDFVTKRKPKAMKLSPIPWGKPDPELAKIVCQHIADANSFEEIVIPYSPFTTDAVRRRLIHYRIKFR